VQTDIHVAARHISHLNGLFVQGITSEHWLEVDVLYEKRDTLSEAVVSIRTLVTFVTWLISRTEFSSSELVL